MTSIDSPLVRELEQTMKNKANLYPGLPRLPELAFAKLPGGAIMGL